jgi:hypothetical protein
VDLGRVYRGVRFEFCIVETPGELDLTIPQNGSAQAEVVAFADECQSEPLRIRVAWNGEWPTVHLR